MKTSLRLAVPLSLTFALLATQPAFAQDTAQNTPPVEFPAMTAQDLVTMPRLGAPTVSKDGRYAIYSVRTTDSETYQRTTTHFLRDLSNPASDPVAVDLGSGAGSAAFGTGMTLFFLSDRKMNGGSKETITQVWRGTVATDGTLSDIARVTQVTSEIGDFSLSPDGKHLTLFGDIPRDCVTFGCSDAKQQHLPGPGDGRLYKSEDGFYRHWDQWETPGTCGRVFVFPLQNGVAAGNGMAVDGGTTAGALIADTPTKPFGGAEEIAWAADSKSVFFAARVSGRDEPTSTNVDIYQSRLDGAAPINLTTANLATDTLPAPSPDGRYLAYAAMARAGYEADRLVIQLRDLKTGRTRALTQNFDRSFGAIAWTPDSRFIIASAQDVLDTPAFRIDIRTGAVEKLDLMAGNEAHIGDLMPLAGNRLLFTRDSLHSPSELYLSADYGQAKPLTSVAREIMGNQASVMTTRFSFAGAKGDTVWGQITKPERSEGKLPAILYVHGGPQGSFNDGWSSRWNPRVLASQGYAVISVDFHGSTGYGQEFTDAINRVWGGAPLEDLQKGLAAALAQDSGIDGERACAMGASYGGYMMNWIAGNWPDRFDCLVQHDGLFDMRSFYYTTEELWFPRWDFGGSYAEQMETYERWNPVNYVDRWKTPMLVVTGEKDFRVPYTQGLASFTALQERGIPAELLVFPTENHWVLSPKNSLQWHNTVFGWLDRWLKPAADE